MTILVDSRCPESGPGPLGFFNRAQRIRQDREVKGLIKRSLTLRIICCVTPSKVRVDRPLARWNFGGSGRMRLDLPASTTIRGAMLVMFWTPQVDVAAWIPFLTPTSLGLQGCATRSTPDPNRTRLLGFMDSWTHLEKPISSWACIWLPFWTIFSRLKL